MAVLKIHTAEPTPLREVNAVVYVGQTRVPIDTVIGAYLDGADADQIVRAYDTLELADVHAVISYYLRHREEVEAYLQQGRQEAAEIRRENQTRFPTARLRERLLARLNQAKLSL